MSSQVRRRIPIIKRLLKKTDQTGECWLWLGGTNGHGYGTIGRGGAGGGHEYVHRAMWIHHYGPIPDGMEVCHRCDVRNCVRPEHLFLGDRFMNMGDASRKARISHGEHRWSAKLTEDDVRRIRREVAAGRTRVSLARELGVSTSTVEYVVTRRLWKHVS